MVNLIECQIWNHLDYRIIIVCITKFVIVFTEHVDLMPTEDGQLSEICESNKYLQIESHWMVLTIIILQCSLLMWWTRMDRVKVTETIYLKAE
jgi:E3 ubiquitin-protein ligase DOA10